MAKLQAQLSTQFGTTGSTYLGLAKDAGKLAAVIEKKLQVATRLESSDPQSIRAKYLRSDISKLQEQLQALRKLSNH